jgi:hypothetical protein
MQVNQTKASLEGEPPVLLDQKGQASNDLHFAKKTIIMVISILKCNSIM